MALPKLVAFQISDKGHNKYLANIDDDDPTFRQFLAYTADDVLSPLARFKIEPVEDGLVQLRSCFTNKLWSRSSANENWIVTSSSEEVKDISNWRCTLFKPIIQGKIVTFTHVQLQNNLILNNTHVKGFNYLCVDSKVDSTEAVKATFIDLTSIVKLPKFITFKGSNDKFLCPIELDHERYEPGYGWSLDRCRFITFSRDGRDDELSNLATVFEVIENCDGSVCFKCVKSGMVLSVTDTANSWLTIEYRKIKENVNNPSRYQFNPFRVSGNGEGGIALQSVYNSKYCTRAQGTIHPGSLAAKSMSIKDREKMQVVEPVTKRMVRVTRLRTEDYILLQDYNVTLDTKEVDHDQIVTFDSEELETHAWSTTISLMTDLSFSIESPTPLFDSAAMSFSASGKVLSIDQFKWGAKQKSSTPVKKTVSVTVPRGSKATVSFKGRVVRFEIPFDYTQTDTISVTGKIETCTNLRDGVYTGEIWFGFKIETENHKLSA